MRRHNNNNRSALGKTLVTAIVAVSLLAVPAAQGQSQAPLSEHPGYFPLEELDILATDKLTIEINLKGALLKLIAAATRKEEPEFSNVIAGLDAVRVRVAPLEDVDAGKVRAGLKRASGWLEKQGWDTIIRTRDESEELYIYLREVGGEISGMAIMAIQEGDEAVIINIVGSLDLSQIARLGEVLDIPQLSQSETLSRPATPTDGKGSN